MLCLYTPHLHLQTHNSVNLVMANAESIKPQLQVVSKHAGMPGRASTPDFKGGGSGEGPCTNSQEEESP